MIFTDYRFLLDVHDINSQISLSFKQGDTGRVLYITLMENGDIFNIPEGCVAVFTALKPDGTIIFNDCEINGNEITYSTTAQTAIVSGKVDCELRLYGEGNTLITSPHFTIFVHPTVYADQIESKDEVNTLTNLISEASAKLENGDFIPKISVGSVATLPAGSAATVEMTGTAEAPVFNFGIPQGPQGQAESLIPDTELSLNSTKPVQNKVITEELNKQKAAAENHSGNTSNPHKVTKQQLGLGNVDNTSDMNKPVSTAQKAAIDAVKNAKVDKATGKGLSSNDFTNDYKEKLDGIETGANKYVLEDGSVTMEKLSEEVQDILHKDSESIGLSVTLYGYKWTDNQQTVDAEGVTESNNIIVTPAPEYYVAWCECMVRAISQTEGKVTFQCESIGTTEIYAEEKLTFTDTDGVFTADTGTFNLFKYIGHKLVFVWDGVEYVCTIISDDYGAFVSCEKFTISNNKITAIDSTETTHTLSVFRKDSITANILIVG